jgi:predicted transcriptional regulator
MSTSERDIIELEKRRQIYNFLMDNPGIHLRALSRKLNIPKTTLNYHLRNLELKDLINSEIKGKFTRYYAKNKIGSIDKKILFTLRNNISRRIIFLTFIYDEVYIDELSRGLLNPITTIAYHLRKLKKLDIVESNKNNGRTAYVLKHRDYIYSLFVRYENSLLDDPLFSMFIYIIDEANSGIEIPIINTHDRKKPFEDIWAVYTKFFPIPFRA